MAIALLDHLKAHRPTYQDRVVLVADDGAYPPEFMDAARTSPRSSARAPNDRG